MNATEIHELLLETLIGAVGGSENEWRRAIGKIRVRPIAFNVMSNWRVHPKGTEQQIEAIENAVATIRACHPYARNDDRFN